MYLPRAFGQCHRITTSCVVLLLYPSGDGVGREQRAPFPGARGQPSRRRQRVVVAGTSGHISAASGRGWRRGRGRVGRQGRLSSFQTTACGRGVLCVLFVRLRIELWGGGGGALPSHFSSTLCHHDKTHVKLLFRYEIAKTTVHCKTIVLF